MEELAVIIPAHNEEQILDTVLRKWIKTLTALKINYKIHVYNDGSTDKTRSLLKNISNNNPQIIVHHKKNTGHGPTILKGYRENSASAKWLFQTDADNEIGTEHFQELWSNRTSYDFIIGTRDPRKRPLTRRIITLLSRFTINIFYGRGLTDVNSPYRLMRSNKFQALFQKIPENTFSPNMIISGIVCRKKIKKYEIPVAYTHRVTGTSSNIGWKLLKASLISFYQTIRFVCSKKSGAF